MQALLLLENDIPLLLDPFGYRMTYLDARMRLYNGWWVCWIMITAVVAVMIGQCIEIHEGWWCQEQLIAGDRLLLMPKRKYLIRTVAIT